jgi:putative endonuclease
VRRVSTDQRHALGRLGEDLAAGHLERLGYDILARRHRTRFGEIDLIASDGVWLVFVEVKARRAGATGPWAALDENKRMQVRRMAAAYLAEVHDRPRGLEVRFDAVGVIVDARGALVSLTHLEGAF